MGTVEPIWGCDLSTENYMIRHLSGEARGKNIQRVVPLGWRYRQERACVHRSLGRRQKASDQAGEPQMGQRPSAVKSGGVGFNSRYSSESDGLKQRNGVIYI